MRFSQSIGAVKGIGPEYEKRLRAEGITTVRELIMYAPFRFDDLRQRAVSTLPPIGALTYFEGQITKAISLSNKNGKRMVKGVFEDAEGSIGILWFHSPYAVALANKKKVRLVGKVELFGNQPTVMAPTVLPWGAESPHVGRLVPIYHEFQGITSTWLRNRIWPLIEQLTFEEDQAEPSGLMTLAQAVKALHFPETFDEYERACTRFAYDELFEELLGQKVVTKVDESGRKMALFQLKSIDWEMFYKTLPFRLSDSQVQVIKEISSDMAAILPMNRMLIGDVGSGKTVVAAALAHATALHDKKTWVMAPTQILAQQHYATLASFLSPHGWRIGLVTGGKTLNEDSMQADILVGTHALLHQTELGTDVGLVVVDEQHRFGVAQREQLRKLVGEGVHFLSMTATPIPRSLALVLLSHLKLSLLQTREGGRKSALTKVVPEAKRLEAYTWVRNYLEKKGGQVFVVCPFIDKSESLDTVRAATAEYDYLRKQIFTQQKVALLHGAMKADEKDALLAQFRAGEYEVLVTTPVVEVGIDIPEANFIVIESAERFGLAQLHQLRGRVGRKGQDAFCFVMPSTTEQDENQRLAVFASTHDGFALAESDLNRRGSGTLFGDLQSGFQSLRFAQLNDAVFVQRVVGDVETFLASVDEAAYATLVQKYTDRLLVRLH